MADRYIVPVNDIENPYCTTLLIKRSKFVAQCAHINNINEAKVFIDLIRKKNADASHNCWAFLAGPPADSAHIGSSDDGEPAGTAGRPMLDILMHCGIGEICVIVSRWFGGIKLGVGGLVRAYQSCVKENLESLPVTEKCERIKYSIIIDYSFVTSFRNGLLKFEGNLIDENYSENAKFIINIPVEYQLSFCEFVANISNGTGICSIIE